MMLNPSLKKGLLLGLISLTLLCSLSWAGKVLNDALVTRPFNHRIWQAVLHQAVDLRGHVDFIKLRAEPRRLNEYLDQLEAVSPDSHPDYFKGRDDELAYWINAHNALALRLILDRYPIDSLEQVPDFESNPRYRLGEEPYTLRQLKDKIVSEYPSRADALLTLTHYTLDSPPLAHTVYEGKTLPRQLNDQVQRLLQNKNMIKPAPKNLSNCGAISISPWITRHQEGFLRLARHRLPHQADATLLDFLRHYAGPEERQSLGLDCPTPPRSAPADPRLREKRL